MKSRRADRCLRVRIAQYSPDHPVENAKSLLEIAEQNRKLTRADVVKIRGLDDRSSEDAAAGRSAELLSRPEQELRQLSAVFNCLTVAKVEES